jgi:hypothetical protein
MSQVLLYTILKIFTNVKFDFLHSRKKMLNMLKIFRTKQMQLRVNHGGQMGRTCRTRGTDKKNARRAYGRT